MSKILIGLFVLVTSSALIVMKLGVRGGAPLSFADNKLQLHLNLGTVVGVALYGLSFIIYLYLLSKYDLGYIIPLTTALVYIVIFTASYFIFKEVFTPLKILGIVMILTGLVFLNLKK